MVSRFRASARRHELSGKIARCDPVKDADRLAQLRAELKAVARADELRAWAKGAAAEMPPFDQDEVAAVAAIAARIDRRHGITEAAS